MGLFSNWNGSDSRKDLRRAQGALTEGYNTGLGALGAGRDQALGYLSPYMDDGASMDFYDRLLAGDQGAVETAMGNPMFSGALQAEQNATLANMNARGMGGSGAAALAAARVNNEDGYRRLGLYRDRAGMGAQFAGMGADIATGYGNNAANLAMQNAQGQAGIHRSIAETRNTGMNNLMGLMGGIGKIAALPMGGGQSFGGSILKNWM